MSFDIPWCAARYARSDRSACRMVALGLVSLTLLAGCDQIADSRPLNGLLAPQAGDRSRTALRPTLPMRDGESPPAVDDSDPRSVTTAFLEAIKTGDAVQVRRMMTERAQAVLERVGVEPVTPGSQLATYHVGQPQFVTSDPNAAHIACRWSDADGTHDAPTAEFIVVMRRGESPTAGWRVAGLVQPGTGDHRIFSFETSSEVMVLVRR